MTEAMNGELDRGRQLAAHWRLDGEIDFLNHGSFGACPTEVLERQAALRAELEAEPVRFFSRRLEGLLDGARSALAGLVGADPEDLAFVPNATYAVNSVLRSLELSPGDELLISDHAYGACRNALEFVAGRAGARVVTARVPFPLTDEEQVLAAWLAAVGPRTRLALVDHLTSPTALVWPLERLVAALDARGVETLVDGAHAVGQLPLALSRLGACYYTSNCHKWLCAPKGSAFLWVRRDRQAAVRPACLSHGASSARTDRPRFWLEFDWTGTADPTPYLCVPEAIGFLQGLVPGGLAALARRNRALALYGRRRLCRALGVAEPAPERMIASLASVPLPPGPAGAESWADRDPLQQALFDRGLEVPVVCWPAPPARLLRISAQAYNHPAQYDRLAAELPGLLRIAATETAF